jgi:hypothetical protein
LPVQSSVYGAKTWRSVRPLRGEVAARAVREESVVMKESGLGRMVAF